MIAPVFAGLLLLAPAARADDAPAPPPALSEMAPSNSTPGWSKQASSLLLYGNDGALTQEIPLKSLDEQGAGTTARETIGGVSPDARMAWTLDRRFVYNQGRTKLLESHRLFRTYGTAGTELWNDDAVDLPERGGPVMFSADSKTLLLAKRGDAGWTAEARTWLGQVLASIGPFPRLTSMALTPNGRYALARWAVPDKSDTHTFVDLAGKKRRDVPSSDLILGLARIDDDGVVRSGSKVVFSFEIAASTPIAVSTPTAPQQ
ncbi:MAG: hypothetical protein ACHQ49_18505 [Elusimicrobiota bacterium]